MDRIITGLPSPASTFDAFILGLQRLNKEEVSQLESNTEKKVTDPKSFNQVFVSEINKANAIVKKMFHPTDDEKFIEYTKAATRAAIITTSETAPKREWLDVVDSYIDMTAAGARNDWTTVDNIGRQRIPNQLGRIVPEQDLANYLPILGVKLQAEDENQLAGYHRSSGFINELHRQVGHALEKRIRQNGIANGNAPQVNFNAKKMLSFSLLQNNGTVTSEDQRVRSSTTNDNSTWERDERFGPPKNVNRSPRQQRPASKLSLGMLPKLFILAVISYGLYRVVPPVNNYLVSWIKGVPAA